MSNPCFCSFDDILLCKHFGSGIKGGCKHMTPELLLLLFIYFRGGGQWLGLVCVETSNPKNGGGGGYLVPKNNPNYFLISNVLLMIFKVLFGTQTPPYLSTNFLTNQIPIPSPYIPKSITCIYKTSNLHLQDLQHMECKYFITYIFT